MLHTVVNYTDLNQLRVVLDDPTTNSTFDKDYIQFHKWIVKNRELSLIGAAISLHYSSARLTAHLLRFEHDPYPIQSYIIYDNKLDVCLYVIYVIPIVDVSDVRHIVKSGTIPIECNSALRKTLQKMVDDKIDYPVPEGIVHIIAEGHYLLGVNSLPSS